MKDDFRLKDLLQQIEDLEEKVSEQEKVIDAFKNEKHVMTSLLHGLSVAGIGVDVVLENYEVVFENQVPENRFGDVMPGRCYEKYSGNNEPCAFCPMRAAIKSKKIERGELEGADGRYYEVFSVPLPEFKGKIKRAIEIVIDITRKKETSEALIESEGNYKNLFENSGDGILLADIKTLDMVEANPAICKMLGYSREELLMKSIKNIHPPDAFENVLREFVLQAEGKKLVAHKIPCVTKSGKVIYADISTTKATIMGRELNVGFFRDVTETLKIEQQLQRSQRIEAIGTLAGGIAHDFNNILGVITGSASLCLNLIEDDEKIREIMQQVLSGAKQAQQLTRQLLTFAKGGTPIKKAVDVGKAIEETAMFVLRGSRSTLDARFGTDLWAADADPGQMGQVISNLVINANQAMASGGTIEIRGENVRIKEDLALSMKEGKYIKITVRDQGVGIPEKYIDKIFDPYFSTKQDGSGLGLSVTYSIVKKHGGHIFVESVMGEGTTFYIYWPASEKVSKPSAPPKVPVHRGKGKILVMDDQEDLRQIAQGLLVHMGYDVVVANDGKEAIEVYRDHIEKHDLLDLVILDLTVPGGMGGREAMHEILKIDPHARAVVSSGYSDDPVMANFSEYGFSAVLPKPYLIEQMADILNNLLEKA